MSKKSKPFILRLDPYLGELDTEIGHLAVFNCTVKNSLDLIKYVGEKSSKVEALNAEEYVRTLAMFVCYPHDSVVDKKRPEDYVLTEEECLKLSVDSLENLACLLLRDEYVQDIENTEYSNAFEQLYSEHIKQKKELLENSKRFSESIGKQYADLNILGDSMQEQLKSISLAEPIINQHLVAGEAATRLIEQACPSYSYIKDILDLTGSESLKHHNMYEHLAQNVAGFKPTFTEFEKVRFPKSVMDMYPIQPELGLFNESAKVGSIIKDSPSVQSVNNSRSYSEPDYSALMERAAVNLEPASERTNNKLDTLVEVGVKTNQYLQEQTEVHRETSEETKKSSDEAKKFSVLTLIVSVVGVVATIASLALAWNAQEQSNEIKLQAELLDQKNKEVEALKDQLSQLTTPNLAEVSGALSSSDKS